REWGAPDAPALVILHGYTGNARGTDDQASAFADQLHVLVPDLRGHGETEWAPEYSINSFVADLEAFVEHLRLPSVPLVGLSLGGSIAFHYAARHPVRVSRLVVWDIGPDGFNAPWIEPALAQSRAAGRETFEDPEEAVQRALAAAPGASEAEVRARTTYNLVQDADGRWRWRYDAAGIGATFSHGRKVEAAAWSAWAEVRCPILLLHGDNSWALNHENAERMVGAAANCRLVEAPDWGHGVPVQNRARYLSVVRPFLLE
ncbi:MAG TPA: alpha/beta hydrolase, partial [Dehalococcoidia bacterium]|nr:alpha/beta hydrolase [Dehalococcoidia bacterium]